MLNINDVNQKEIMKKYYRTSDMINLIDFFPQLSPIKNLTIIENLEDYNKNIDVIKNLSCNRVDTLKGRIPIMGIENTGLNNGDLLKNTLSAVKAKDRNGVLVLFNVAGTPTQRYERLAGISVGIDLGKDIMIDAVSKGFDGREVSKSICTHERYYIPWFDLRKVTIDNFKNYQTFRISDNEYKQTRFERIEFLKSVGLCEALIEENIPRIYQSIPDIVWLNLIKDLLKKLEKNEEILANYELYNFAISGHTDKFAFAPWQMFDKSRYTLVKK